MIRLLVSLSLWWCLCAAVLAGQLLDVVAEPEFDTLRISLQVSGPTQFRYSLLDKPDRLLIELSDTEAATNVTPAAVRAAPINNLRLNRNGKNLKLVFELSSSVLVKTYRLKAAKNQSDRIVLELTGFKTVSAKSPSSAPKGAGADEDRVAEAKPLAQKDLSAQSEPAAQTERLAQRDVLVQKEPAAQKQPSAQQPKLQPTAGQKEATAKPLPQAPEKRSQVDVSRPVNEPVNEPAPPPPATLDKESKQSILLPLGKVPTVLDPPKAPKTADTPAQESHAPIRGRKIIVALDAGHGGKDTGAVGPKGVREKDVVLAIARELSAQLNQDGRFKVVMTRADDKFIPLKGRRDKARKLKADVFISIHADAFVTAQARGASVFALSQRGATSEMARFLAEHENSSDLLGSVGGVSLEDKDEILAGVLVD
ncbi:MAG TPA: N-acetylmuramoyl-L-alanine amidase, partial [Cellvibrionaceae bacterium]